MSKLGRGIDKLEFDILKSKTRSLLKKGLAQSNNPLLGTNTASLDHQKILLDNTVVWETTHRCNVFLSPIEFSLGVMGLLSNFAELVNFLVQLSSVMVSVLTSSGNSERNSSRMPSSNTCNLPQTPVSLTRKTSNTPTSNNTFITLTLGHSNDVNHFIFLEHSINRNLLLKETVCKVHLLCNGTTIDLNLHYMGFLLLQTLHFPDLSVSQHTDNSCILLQFLKLGLNVFLPLITFILL
uniref:Uncharacterized protein n=1 Tax=Medicago truncatula TaxID=3880 RepID=I3S5Z6_MEDTR|nr:unknown [Medicago truncatula]